MTITHALIKVASADHRAVVNFYAQALKPLGSKQLANFPNGMTGFGSQSPEWWIVVGDPTSTVHIAFGAPGKSATMLRSLASKLPYTDSLGQTRPPWTLSIRLPLMQEPRTTVLRGLGHTFTLITMQRLSWTLWVTTLRLAAWSRMVQIDSPMKFDGLKKGAVICVITRSVDELIEFHDRFINKA